MLDRCELFCGERLQLAREFKNWTQTKLGEEVAASAALISLCETGKKKDPSPDLVDAFAHVLGFEPGFFYRPIEDAFNEGECSFRHRRSTPEKLKTHIRAHGTLIGMVVAELRKRFQFPTLNIPSFHAVTDEQIEAAAERTRLHWNLGLEAPIMHVGRVMEHAGIIIVPHFANAKVDAFSRAGRTSVIFLNQTVDSPSRWNFDIAHECGHLVMHTGAETGTEETEAAADRFASAFLMPRKAFSREFRGMVFSWQRVLEIKGRWRVSAAAIVRRAYDLRLIDAVTYRRAYQTMSARGWRSGKGEPCEPTFQQPELLTSALHALGKTVSYTTAELCRDLQFTPDTFEAITQVEVCALVNKGEVVSFRVG
jgi:Zn-dependent peptidase ImmA (M78 family)/transcriptional regulator with XRE-family HTH domain